MFSKVTANLAGAKKRYETLNGKRHLVVPVVMLDEGVWTGSEGALYYSKAQLKKNPLSWNSKPVIIRHPESGDTACTPAILEAQQVGMMLNTHWDDPLKTEFWCDDEAKLARLAPMVAADIQAGRNSEVSTGLHHDLDEQPGTWNGKAFKASVLNIQPDHLAILPDAVGAFSIADGGGLLRNAAGDLSYKEVKDHLHMEKNGAIEPYNATVPYDRRIWIIDVYPKTVVYEQNGKCWQQTYRVKDGKAEFTGEPSEVMPKTTYVSANGGLVIPSLLQASNTVPVSRFTINSEGNLVMAKVYTDVEKQALTQRGAQHLVNVFKLDQGIAMQVVQNAIMQGVAELVEAATKDLNPGVPAAVAAGAATQPVAMPIPNPNDRSNVHGPGAGNLSITNPLDPGIAAAVATGATQQPVAMPIPNPNDRSNVHNAVQQCLQAMPVPIRNVFVGLLARDQQERTQLIAALTSNASCPFNADWLALQDTEMLRGMVSMTQNTKQQAAPPVPPYAGQGGPPMFRTPTPPAPITNQADLQNQYTLPFPTMGFDGDATQAS